MRPRPARAALDAFGGDACGIVLTMGIHDAHNQRRPLRGYKLDQIREAYRRLSPLCERCRAQGRVRVWTQLDHRVALSNGGADFDVDPGQRQGLCAPCHAEKTAEDRGRIHRGGCDENGLPLGDNHPWNQKRS
jgi:hypothetical protein